MLQKSLKPGFSFIEIMIALLIIGVMAGVLVPNLMRWVGRGKTTQTTQTLKVIKQAIQEYKIDNGKYPERLDDLISKPEGASNWQGPYVGDADKGNVDLPRDAWDGDFKYQLHERGSKPPYALYSEGDPEKEDDRIDA